MTPGVPPRLVPPLPALLALLLAAACADAQTRPDLPSPPREFRAAWIATVNNIDWPSKPGLSTERQREELVALLDRAAELRLNAVVLQVRPTADALYPSKLEPWSEWLTGEQGKAPEPGWDPLAFAVQAAHDRGLELHAWFNPFRARHSVSFSKPAREHVLRTHREWVVEYGKQHWIDPGIDGARQHAIAVFTDVVERYDVDGIHIDDYFYPYPVRGVPFPDDASFRRYRAQGGKLERGDWRRANIDALVSELNDRIHELKPWVKFGISPFGIARPGVPEGIQAGIDQFAELYADVPKWLANGWCDYLAPQLYWPIRQKPQAYPVLLDYWIGQNRRGRHIWIGNSSSRAMSSWGPDELVEQIALTRAASGAGGNIHFSIKALRKGTGVGEALSDGPYRRQALVPPSPWLDHLPPEPPALSPLERRSDGVAQRWTTGADAALCTVYLRARGQWLFDQVLPAVKPGILITTEEVRDKEVDALAVCAVDRCGNESAPAVRDLR